MLEFGAYVHTLLLMFITFSRTAVRPCKKSVEGSMTCLCPYIVAHVYTFSRTIVRPGKRWIEESMIGACDGSVGLCCQTVRARTLCLQMKLRVFVLRVALLFILDEMIEGPGLQKRFDELDDMSGFLDQRV